MLKKVIGNRAERGYGGRGTYRLFRRLWHNRDQGS